MPVTERLVQPLLETIIRHPRVVLTAFLLAAVALGWEARHFQIDASADTLLTKNDKDYIRTQIVNRRFSPQEFLLVAYKPKKWPVFSEQSFKDLMTLRRRLGEMDRVAAVHSILDVPLLSLTGGDLGSIKDPSQWTVENKHFKLEQIRQAFKGNPIYEDLLINKAQTATAIQVLFKDDQKLKSLHDRILDIQSKTLETKLSAADEKELKRLKKLAEPMDRELDDKRSDEIKAIRGIADTYRDHADIYLGGVNVLAFQLIQIIKHDLAVFGGVIAVIICMALYSLFKKLRWVIIPVVCCTCSVLSTVGLFALFGFKATVLSANFIVLQIILTLSLVIYLVVQYHEYRMEQSDWEQTELVRKTLLRKASPIFYAGIATVVGFGSLVFSNIEPVIDFGWMMIIATIFSIGISLILFPAMMAMFNRERGESRRGLFRYLLNFLAAASLRYPAAIGILSLGILAVSAVGILRLDVENSFINYFRDTTRVHQELTFIDRQFGGSTPLDVVYTIANDQRKKDLVMTANTVQTLQRVQKSLEAHPGVGKILSVVNFTELAKELNRNKPITEYELTVVYWTMDKTFRNELLGSFFSQEHQQLRISARIRDSIPGLNRAQLLANIRADMQQLGISQNRYMLTNLFVLYQGILQRLFRSQILTMGIVYAVLSLTLLVLFRSFKIALIGIIPNMLAIAVVLGVMGWLKISLDLMTITIASIAMGIAVNDSIQYIHRYLEELHDGSPQQAVERSHASVAYAISYTSTIVILGFSLLAFSDFMPSVLFGLLTGLALAMGLIFNLSLLAVLLNWFVKKPLRHIHVERKLLEEKS